MLILGNNRYNFDFTLTCDRKDVNFTRINANVNFTQFESLDNVDFRSFTDSWNFDLTLSRRPRTLISLREQLKVHFTQHVSSVERPRARMSARFFAKIEHGQNSSKLRMPICLYLQKTALHIFLPVSVPYSRNTVCKNTCMSQSVFFKCWLQL